MIETIVNSDFLCNLVLNFLLPNHGLAYYLEGAEEIAFLVTENKERSTSKAKLYRISLSLTPLP